MKTDDIDKEIVEILTKKSEQYIEILKKKKDKELFSPEEKQHIVDLIHETNNGPIPDAILQHIFTEILTASMTAVAPVSVAYLGPEGTFTSMALTEIFGNSVETKPQKTISDVFRAVEADDADYGVVPVENSTEGAVTYTLDELIETDLNIISEHFVRISYCLVSQNSDISNIKKVYSHPQPIGQCKGWLRMNMPDSELIPVDSTSYAAELAASDHDTAAIASYVAAELYDLEILANRIEDLRQNYTRFFVIGRKKNKPSGKDKTSIVCAVDDKSGALLRILQPLSDSGINMTKIESRPDKKKMWAYNFFIDFYGHKDEQVVIDTLEILRNECIFLKILGSYPEGV